MATTVLYIAAVKWLMMLEVPVQWVLVASSVTAAIGVGGWRRLAPGLKSVYAFFLVGRPSFEYEAGQFETWH